MVNMVNNIHKPSILGPRNWLSRVLCLIVVLVLGITQPSNARKTSSPRRLRQNENHHHGTLLSQQMASFSDTAEEQDDNYHRSLGKGLGKGKSKSNAGDDLGPDDCTDEDLQTFTRSVLVNFVGAPENLNVDQIMVLQDSFLQAYNRLGEVQCSGGSVRKVLDVTIALDPGQVLPSERRQLQFFGDGRPFRPYSLAFEIVWQCNSCGPLPGLFGNDAGRKRQLEASKYQDFASRNLQGGASCLPCETASTEDFLVNFNTVLQEFRDNGEIFDGIDTADSLSELEEVTCDEGINLVETTLFFEFQGDPSEASSEELAILASSVQNTINDLNSLNDEICDLFFRVVVAVEADIGDSSQKDRNLQFSFPNSSSFIPFLIFFNIIFQCQGCPPDTTLFGNDAVRRDLSIFSKVDRRLQAATVSENCLCAIGVDSNEFRPPTRAEFDVSFNQTVTSLVAIEAVNFISEVGGTTEIDDINCTANLDTRVSQLVIEAQGDPNDISAANVSALEQAAQDSLNDLYFETCDPEVRFVVNVTFGIIGSSDMVENRNRKLQFGDFIFNFAFFFTIIFQCRGCPPGASLFGDDAARRLHSTSTDLLGLVGRGSRRHLQNADTCFCDVNVIDDLRTPTLEEFVVIFADEVQALDLPVIVNTSSVFERDPPSPTTAAPITAAPITAAPITAAPVTLARAPITAAPTTPTTELTLACEAIKNGQVYETDRKLEVTYVYELLTIASVNLDIAVDTLDGAVSSFLANTLVDCAGVQRRRVALGVSPGRRDEIIGSNCNTLEPAMDQLCFTMLGSMRVFTSNNSSITQDDARTIIYEMLTSAFNGVQQERRLLDITEFVGNATGIEGVYFEGGTLAPVQSVSPSLTPRTSQPVAPAPIPSTPQPVTPQPMEAPVMPQSTTAAPVEPTTAPVTTAPVVHPDTDDRRICRNDETGDSVCECRPGYSLPDCDPIDECQQDPCSFPGGYCENRAADNGFYACGCRTNDGWNNGNSSDEHGLTSCVAKNECTEGDPPCHPDATCTNLSPGYKCKCNGNLIGNGKLECDLPPTDTPSAAPVDPLSPEAGCQSDSECTGTNEFCNSTQIPPSCDCPFGYFRLGPHCQPENECGDPDRNNCDANVGRSTCTDLTPGYACSCIDTDGWVDAPNAMTPGTICVDKDECSTGEDNCDESTHVCVNRLPPTKWDCVAKTPAPTPPPTPSPIPLPTAPSCVTEGNQCGCSDQCCPGLVRDRRPTTDPPSPTPVGVFECVTPFALIFLGGECGTNPSPYQAVDECSTSESDPLCCSGTLECRPVVDAPDAGRCEACKPPGASCNFGERCCIRYAESYFQYEYECLLDECGSNSRTCQYVVPL